MTAGTYYEKDNIYFTRAEVKAKPGINLGNGARLIYVNLSDESETAHEFTRGGITFDDDIEFRLQGVSKSTYEVVYHENATGAKVFYGEHWNAAGSVVLGDSLNHSLFRADACLAGWAFSGSDDGFVYTTADADFITAYENRLATESSTDLYAVWTDNSAACLVPTENVVVSLSVM